MQDQGSTRRATHAKNIRDKQNRGNSSDAHPPSLGTVVHPFPPAPDGSDSACAVPRTSPVSQSVPLGPAKRTAESLTKDKATLARILADAHGRSVTESEYNTLTHLVIKISFGRHASDDEEVRNIMDAQTLILNTLADRHRFRTEEKLIKVKVFQADIESYARNGAVGAAESRVLEANMDLQKEQRLEQLATEQLELQERRLKEVKHNHKRAPTHKRMRTLESTYDASAPTGEDME